LFGWIAFVGRPGLLIAARLVITAATQAEAVIKKMAAIAARFSVAGNPAIGTAIGADASQAFAPGFVSFVFVLAAGAS
jgi:hypothetical protein